MNTFRCIPWGFAFVAFNVAWGSYFAAGWLFHGIVPECIFAVMMVLIIVEFSRRHEKKCDEELFGTPYDIKTLDSSFLKLPKYGRFAQRTHFASVSENRRKRSNTIRLLARALNRLFTMPDKQLRLLKAFRWLLPRAAREDLDIVIADIEEDILEMKQQKRSRRFIFAVMFWHVTRTITAYVVDGARGALLKLLPFLHYFTPR